MSQPDRAAAKVNRAFGKALEDVFGPLFGSPREERRRQAFWRFHRENPHVYGRLAELAREAKAAGCVRIGMRLLWERLRWDLTVTTMRSVNVPKMNDWYPPFYARLLMQLEPDLVDLFETRGGRATP